MDDMPKKSLTDTMNSAKDYIAKLEELVKSVEAAEQQVELSTAQSVKEVKDTFAHLAFSIVELLTKRRDSLLSEISTIHDDGLAPLKACRELIASKLANTELYVAEGGDILRVGGLAISESMEKFCEKASFLGSLPAVPQLEEVPYVSFQGNKGALETHINNSIEKFGRISRMGPVQITQMEEKPGALLVHWEEVDFEHPVDIHAFRLQCAYGDIRDKQQLLKSNFHDVYEGPESQFLVRDLKPIMPYTFRVSCLAEGETEWSAWSLPRIGNSNILPFSWATDNKHYNVSCEGKIATKISNDSSILLSCSAQFGPGHCIDFVVLERGDVSEVEEQGIGLVSGPLNDDSLVQQGTLFLSVSGSIYVDGLEKMMKLPPLQVGSNVSFMCDYIRDNRLRVTVGAANKTVIYDWTPTYSKENESLLPKLYFAIRFKTAGWKVLVE